jgi:hypothetical protein
METVDNMRNNKQCGFYMELIVLILVAHTYMSFKENDKDSNTENVGALE